MIRFGRIWIALTAAMLWMLPYLSRYLDARHRQVYLWQRSDLLGILATAGIIAAAVYVLYGLVKWSRSARLMAIFKICFIISIIYLLSANLMRAVELSVSPKWVRNLALGILLCTVAAGALRHRFDREKLVRDAVAIAWLLSIVPLVFMAWMCSYQSEVGGRGQLQVEANVKPGQNVYLIILDDWSYRRSFDDHKIRPELTNLAALATESIVFHRAFTPTNKPPETMQVFLAQATDGSANLIEQANRMNFYTVMVGYYFNYRTMLGNSVDFCRSFSGYKIPDQTVMDAALYHFVKTVRYPFRRLPGDTDKLLDSYVMNRMHSRRLPVIHKLVGEIVSQQSGATFAVLHYPVPHMPFVFDRDRTKPLLAIYDRSLENYRDNLRYTDKLVGQLIETLKAAGKFDDAILVLVSNHDWLDDVELNRRTDSGFLQWQHIPLMVKLPRQAKQFDTDAAFPVTRLQRLIVDCLEGELDAEEVAGGIIAADDRR